MRMNVSISHNNPPEGLSCRQRRHLYATHFRRGPVVCMAYRPLVSRGDNPQKENSSIAE
jgi:hypothetical protein